MHNFSIRYILKFFLPVILLGVSVHGQDNSVKKIIFEEKKIEGKIRRPQLVLIKADQRPTFSPMVLQGLGSGTNILQSVKNDLITDSPYKGAFQFNDIEISNYQK
jgi:hypothetical protein